jgi:hypothetical protein
LPQLGAQKLSDIFVAIVFKAADQLTQAALIAPPANYRQARLAAIAGGNALALTHLTAAAGAQGRWGRPLAKRAVVRQKQAEQLLLPLVN